MASSKRLQLQEDVAPNLIPMIDIMFLLLLFFMLGADMGQRELEEVMLPKARFVKEDKVADKETTSDKLVVNVYHRYSNEVECEAYKNSQICREKSHWLIGIKGRNYPNLKDLEARLKIEGDSRRSAPMDKLSSGGQVPFSERPVLVRGDASAPYGQVQEVINACAKVGIYKIECGAARPPDAELNEISAKKI